jgi:peptidoglycan biosynthesis protein MviN/MurJ (putative lipid II flippase)
VTRPKLFLGVLAAACVGTLLWYAWLILATDLPRGATIATWVLWLLGAAAVVTLLAYLREFLAHRRAVGREATWRPLPGLVLLWLGGLTALVSFAFILPDKSGADGAAAAPPAATARPLR